MPTDFKTIFLLDPDVIYLNHGAFGACPRPVFEVYQQLQRELERQPQEFLSRRIQDRMAQARSALATFLGCQADEVVYFPNPTTAINMVARSLELKPGDEILSTDHEYGAMDRTWRFICEQSGARYVRQPIPLPLTTVESFAQSFWNGVNAHTRVIFLSHITSPTALRFPVEKICQRARQAGILCIVDGAHAPGQIPLDLTSLGADLYTGACHKWLCAPKGSAFLYARKEIQDWLRPLVVSWGWEADQPSESRFIDHHEWQGTRDPAAFLSVPAAIEFQRQHNWEAVRTRCHQLAAETRARINTLTGLEPICPDSTTWFVQMFTAQLPEVDAEALQQQLYETYRLEVALKRWNEQPLIRVSFQAYNDQKDSDALLSALQEILT
ncbi:MAG: aminotransferase class V-fold PLP-dependent enzyme [Anaerolineales bacterium]|nr:aminotransferase class V-fold PLP-dependent enzyme [Anaerolineales bacterium]